MDLNADVCKHVVNFPYIVPLLHHLAYSRVSHAVYLAQITMKLRFRQRALPAEHISRLRISCPVYNPSQPMPAQKDRQAQDNAGCPPYGIECPRADMMCLAFRGPDRSDLRV